LHNLFSLLFRKEQLCGYVRKLLFYILVTAVGCAGCLLPLVPAIESSEAYNGDNPKTLDFIGIPVIMKDVFDRDGPVGQGFISLGVRQRVRKDAAEMARPLVFLAEVMKCPGAYGIPPRRS
jgi:hypothetical protein